MNINNSIENNNKRIKYLDCKLSNNSVLEESKSSRFVPEMDLMECLATMLMFILNTITLKAAPIFFFSIQREKEVLEQILSFIPFP